MFLKKISIQFSEILFYSLPLVILSGPFLPDLFISLIAIIFLTITIIEKRWKYFISKFSIFFISFFIFLIISSIISDFISFSLKTSLFYFRFYIFSLAVWFLLEENNIVLKRFTVIFFTTFVISLISGYYQFFFGSNIFGIESESYTRLTLLFNDKLYLGGYLSRLFPLLIGLLILNFSNYKENKLIIIIGLSLLIITDVLIFITGERTAFGLLLITTVSFIFFLSKLKFIRIISFLISLIIIAIITFSFPDIRERNVNHTLRQLGVTADQYSPRHTPMYMGAFKIYQDNLIIGTGPNTYREVCKKEEYNINKYTCSTHVHNTYLQAMAEVGTIGLIYIVIAFIYVVVKLSKQLLNLILNKKTSLNDYQVCLLICFLLTLWPLQPSMSLFNNWINVIYYLPLGFYLHSINSSQKKSN